MKSKLQNMTTTENEQKREKFNRIIAKRIPNFKLACERLYKVANRFNYDYTDAQRDEIVKIVQKECDTIKQKFNEQPFNVNDK